MYRYLIGFDPGGTTGICVLRANHNGVWKVMSTSQVSSLFNLRVHMNLSRVIQQPCVVMESVIMHGSLTAGKAAQLKAVGVIESTGQTVLTVTPEERGRVKKVPKYITGDHAKDAYRVAVAFALKKGLMTQDDTEYLLTETGRWNTETDSD